MLCKFTRRYFTITITILHNAIRCDSSPSSRIRISVVTFLRMRRIFTGKVTYIQPLHANFSDCSVRRIRKGTFSKFAKATRRENVSSWERKREGKKEREREGSFQRTSSVVREIRLSNYSRVPRVQFLLEIPITPELTKNRRSLFTSGERGGKTCSSATTNERKKSEKFDETSTMNFHFSGTRYFYNSEKNSVEILRWAKKKMHWRKTPELFIREVERRESLCL